MAFASPRKIKEEFEEQSIAASIISVLHVSLSGQRSNPVAPCVSRDLKQSVSAHGHQQ